MDVGPATAGCRHRAAHPIPGGCRRSREYGGDAEQTVSLRRNQGRSIAHPPGGDIASFFTLIEEQLGLKLIPVRETMDVLVIDHIERPSEN
jgi:uncharacterized protein (TIGR03435 family)